MIEKDYLWWGLKEVADEHDQMNRSYFEKGEAGKYPYFDILHKMMAIVADTDNRPQLSCIDVGCGAGWQAVHMANVGLDKKIIYEGMDISPYMCQLAKQNYPAGNFYVADIMGFNPEKKWDIVMACGSIEHFSDWKGFLGQLALLSNDWLMVHKVFFRSGENPTERLVCPTYAGRTQTRMVIQYKEFIEVLSNLGFKITQRMDWDAGNISCVLAKKR